MGYLSLASAWRYLKLYLRRLTSPRHFPRLTGGLAGDVVYPASVEFLSLLCQSSPNLSLEGWGRDITVIFG